MEIDACVYLGDPDYAHDPSGLWTDMTVRRSHSGEWLITGSATGQVHDADAIATELSRIWEERLRYNHRSAHTVICTPRSITLLAVTQSGPHDFWVTANVRVELIT